MARRLGDPSSCAGRDYRFAVGHRSAMDEAQPSLHGDLCSGFAPTNGPVAKVARQLQSLTPGVGSGQRVDVLRHARARARRHKKNLRTGKKRAHSSTPPPNRNSRSSHSAMRPLASVRMRTRRPLAGCTHVCCSVLDSPIALPFRLILYITLRLDH